MKQQLDCKILTEPVLSKFILNDLVIHIGDRVEFDNGEIYQVHPNYLWNIDGSDKYYTNTEFMYNSHRIYKIYRPEYHFNPANDDNYVEIFKNEQCKLLQEDTKMNDRLIIHLHSPQRAIEVYKSMEKPLASKQGTVTSIIALDGCVEHIFEDDGTFEKFLVSLTNKIQNER